MAGEQILKFTSKKLLHEKTFHATVGKFNVELGDIHYQAPQGSLEEPQDRKLVGIKIGWRF